VRLQALQRALQAPAPPEPEPQSRAAQERRVALLQPEQALQRRAQASRERGPRAPEPQRQARAQQPEPVQLRQVQALQLAAAAERRLVRVQRQEPAALQP
jgi:hypothetical protein